MRLISVVTPCYNEEGNVRAMYERIHDVFVGMPQYEYEHIFIDNRSTDRTASILKDIAKEDGRAKIILNVRNFGPGRSGGYALLQAKGDAVIGLACDFQDPPELIPRFLAMWEDGYKVVFGQKTKSEESKTLFGVRKTYYRIIKSISDIDQLENVTGFGLYDKEVVNYLKWMNDPDPYFRASIAELGYDVGLVQYKQPTRKMGKSSYNLFRYVDTAFTGIMTTSKKPLRFATYIGFSTSLASFALAIVYLVLKLVFWDSFNLGIAPIIIGMFFFSSVQLAFIGVLGEYIGAILSRVTRRPLVVERERLNFTSERVDEVIAPESAINEKA
jgi:polyisoprenyl-phosphate glycosyltransferase